MTNNNILFPLDSLVLTPNSTTPQRIIAIDIEAEHSLLAYCIELPTRREDSFLHLFQDEIERGQIIVSPTINPYCGRCWYHEDSLTLSNPTPQPTQQTLSTILTTSTTPTTFTQDSNQFTYDPSTGTLTRDDIGYVCNLLKGVEILPSLTPIPIMQALELYLSGKDIYCESDNLPPYKIDEFPAINRGIDPSTLTFYTTLPILIG